MCWFSPLRVGASPLLEHRQTPGALAPVRVMLSRSIIAYRPHPPHSPAQRDFAALRLIPAAFAVPIGPKRPASGSVLSMLFLLGMRPLRPRGVHRLHTPSFFADDAGLHRASNCSALPTPPPSASGGTSFSRLNRFACATACRVACLPGGSDWSFLEPTETFTFGLSTSRSPFSPPSITTVAAGQLPPAGLSPAGSAASIRCTEADGR
jgi:hypothetical protein